MGETGTPSDIHTCVISTLKYTHVQLLQTLRLKLVYYLIILIFLQDSNWQGKCEHNF